MKKLLLVLTLLCTTAHADEWMEAANAAGGKILFLKSACSDTLYGRQVIATTKEGRTIHGCWFYFADMVHVVWNGQGGKTSAYDPKELVYRKDGE